MEGPVTYKPLKNFYLSLMVLILLVQVIGIGIGFFYDFTIFDPLMLLLISVAVPLVISSLSFYVSWKLKRKNIEYTPVEWEFVPIQLKLDQAKKLTSQYRKKYARIVAVPYIWYYYMPIFLIILLFTFPLYSQLVLPSLLWVNPFVYLFLLYLIFAISFWGGWRSTSTDASKDFTLPNIREANKLAQTQMKVSGISHVRVVMDKAEHFGYEIYRDPRIVARIEGIHKESYIESWTEEFGSIDRMMVRILEKNDLPEVVWWWQNRDRWFRKYIGDSEDGYYVKNPVPSNIQELGVKDVKLVTENAVAILVLEWQKVRESSDNLKDILSSLGVKSESAKEQ